MELKLIVGLGPLFVPPFVKPTVAGAFNMGLLKCLTRLAIHAPGAAVAVASGSDIGNPQELPHTVETSPGYLATKKKVRTRERATIDHRQRRGRAGQTERETVIIGEVGMHRERAS